MTGRRGSTRRAVLVGLGASLAGCLGTGGDDGDGDPDDDDDSGSSRYTGPMVGDTELAHNFPMAIRDPETGDEVVEVHYHREGSAGWHYQPLELDPGESRTFQLTVLDAEFERIDISEGSDFAVVTVPTDDDGPPNLDVEIEGDELTIATDGAGRTELQLEIRGPDGGAWQPEPLPVQVGSAE